MIAIVLKRERAKGQLFFLRKTTNFAPVMCFKQQTTELGHFFCYLICLLGMRFEKRPLSLKGITKKKTGN